VDQDPDQGSSVVWRRSHWLVLEPQRGAGRLGGLERGQHVEPGGGGGRSQVSCDATETLLFSGSRKRELVAVMGPQRERASTRTPHRGGIVPMLHSGLRPVDMRHENIGT